MNKNLINLVMAVAIMLVMAPVTVNAGTRQLSTSSISDINTICSRKAKAETNIKSCYYDVNSTENPYDVAWDYGETYNKLVAKCDWDLVFDAAYYKKAFPNLALQYHDDDALLLKHFQTVGIHDGRQGNSDFNVDVYKNNCDKNISRTFKNNYASYYIYYMLYNNIQKTVNTKPLKDSPKMCKITLTYLQAKELDLVNNKYRKEVNAAPIVPNAELNALAEYRAYLNAHDDIEAHAWNRAHANTMSKYLERATGSQYGKENNIRNLDATKRPVYTDNYADFYATSDSHYEAMTFAKDKSIGISNEAWSSELGFSEQFDIFGLK